MVHDEIGCKKANHGNGHHSNKCTWAAFASVLLDLRLISYYLLSFLLGLPKMLRLNCNILVGIFGVLLIDGVGLLPASRLFVSLLFVTEASVDTTSDRLDTTVEQAQRHEAAALGVLVREALRPKPCRHPEDPKKPDAKCTKHDAACVVPGSNPQRFPGGNRDGYLLIIFLLSEVEDDRAPRDHELPQRCPDFQNPHATDQVYHDAQPHPWVEREVLAHACIGLSLHNDSIIVKNSDRA
mmetsp:Transcript_87371/g.209011  ORF Transcript_87371/g.209011 Transcript_87371/m.209011 type:complete len:239 (+) Transcript_87371:654-1370(+)